MVHLVLVVVTPSTALLAIATVLVAAEAALTVAAVLAGLVALASRVLAAKASKAAVLASRLAAMEGMLLLDVAWVSAITLLSRLWWWQRGLSWSSVGSRSWTSSLSERWTWTVAGLSVTEWLQVIRGTLLGALSVLLRLSLVRGATAERIHRVKSGAAANRLSSSSRLLGSTATILAKACTDSAVATVQRRSAEGTSSWRWSVIVWSLWRHSISVWLIIHSALSVWTSTVVALTITLIVVVHVSSVIWAGIVWVAVWVLLSATWLLALWLGWVRLLTLARLSGSLLGLGWWVWS